MPRSVFKPSGSVTNVAARLAGIGGDDAVHIGPETRCLVRRRGHGPAAAQNVEEPVRIRLVETVSVAL
jgi:class 3 adenylate cyclase